MYKIEFLDEAKENFKDIPEKHKRQINSKLNILKQNPRSVINNSIPVEGRENVFRIKSGIYRVVYSIYDKILLILVLDIDHRKDVYR